MIISATASAGSLIYQDGQPQRIKQYLEENENKTIYIIFDTVKPNRTLQQNKLLWKIYEVIANETGETAESIHEYCKEAFLPRFFMERNGEMIATEKSTTRLKTREFSTYISEVRAWAAQFHGIVTPGEDE